MTDTRALDNAMTDPMTGAAGRLPDEPDRDGLYYCCLCGARIRPEQVDPCDDFDELYCAACSTRCDLCGRRLPDGEVLRIGDTAVCEDCREEYVG